MSDAEIQQRQAVAYQQGKKEAAAEIARLRRQRDTAREALKYYADEGGEGRQFMVCHAVDREPVESVHDMGYRARRALATLDGEDQT